MKIVNKKRFTIFVVLVSFIFFLLTSMAAEAVKNFAHQAREIKGLTAKEIQYIENNFEKVKVTVSKGDTSWTIQSSLAPNYDTRQVLYLTGKLNGKNMGNIKIGETLIFLKEREGN